MTGEYGDLWIANFDDGTMMRCDSTSDAVNTIDSGAANPELTGH